jgi:hypothetical protein
VDAPIETHLALPHQVGQHGKRFFDVGIRYWAVKLVKIDIIGLKPTQ